jgi:dTDP-L-rhamnose 4-epimerase
MADRVLVTGGAGFIGSHLADELLARGYRVRVLDNLSPQVHGEGAGRPDYLASEVELIEGDLRDPDTVRRALAGVDGVFHLAAAVGVGQSMYQIADYCSVNTAGTAVLLEALVAQRPRKLVVASSMSIYGEGLYRTADGELVSGARRSRRQLLDGDWELRDTAGRWLSPVPTPETKAPDLASVYALTKYDQERLCLMVGEAYGFPVTGLRFFNAYGPRQALSNPYTGVMAIFAARYLNGQPPLVFEDGEQRRDFVHVRDVARACRLAYESEGAAGEVLNVGSGMSISVRELAERFAAIFGCPQIAPQITGEYRVGDIRHCFADVSRAAALLGFTASVPLDEGLCELAEWLPQQRAVDRVDAAHQELVARGLTL